MYTYKNSNVQRRMARPTSMMTSRTRAGPWGKSSAAGHRERMGISKRVLIRSVSLLLGKTDRLHALIFATQRVGVFITESDGCIVVSQARLSHVEKRVGSNSHHIGVGSKFDV